jgi:hypothetical protein
MGWGRLYLLFVLAIGLAWGISRDLPPGNALVAHRLEVVLPELAASELTLFSDNGDCRELSDRLGSYAAPGSFGDNNRCINPLWSFTPAGDAELARLGELFAGRNWRIDFARLHLDFEAGKIIDGEFSLAGTFWVWSKQRYFHYQPGYGELPADLPGEMHFEAVDANWYVEVVDDWN